MTFPFRRPGCRSVLVWAVLVLALTAPAARAQWTLEPIGASEGVRELY